ncbi:MAG TPA: hypothetical protein PL105_08310, partial [Caldilineaceae bacterium]|nr:hypothetical protein [Caldilineaceae bacterium]
LVAERLWGVLRAQTRYRAIYSRKLLVDLSGREKEFEAILGTNALLLDPLMDWAFKQAQVNDNAIIL